MEPAVASVLVVDDEPSMRDVLEVGLRQHGFNVRLASDASAALNALERQRVDVILLDVMMPSIDGLTLVPMLRRLTEIPIVMLSAKASVADRIAALDAGADDYVVKPFDFGELSARLRSAAPPRTRRGDADRVRRPLDRPDRRLIHTVRGVGYTLR